MYARVWIGWPFGIDSIACKDEEVFFTAEKISLNGLAENDTRIIMMPDKSTKIH